MKRLFLFSICCYLSYQLNGQVINNPKYQVVNYTADSTLALVQLKKRFGLYNVRQKRFEIEPGKSQLIYLSGAECYLQITEKNALSVHFVLSDSFFSIYEYNSEAYAHFTHPHNEAESGNLIRINGVLQNVNSEIVTPNDAYLKFDWSKIGVKKITSDLLLITNYKNELADIFYEKNSRLGLKEEYCKSGVYNSATKTWVVEPIYQECFVLHDYLYCARKKLIQSPNFELEIFFSQYEYSYDIYKIEGENLTLKHEKVTTLDGLDVTSLLGVDQALQQEDLTHYVVSKNNKQGFIRFQLFDPWELNMARFLFQDIVSTNADFIGFSPYYKTLGVVYADSLNSVWLYGFLDFYQTENPNCLDEKIVMASATQSVEFFGSESYYETDKLIRINGGEAKIISKNEQGGFDFLEDESRRTFAIKFGLQLTNDRFVVYNDYGPDMTTDFALIDMYGEDSLDESGNYVYGIMLGYEKSGAYDLKQQKWLVLPNAQIVNQQGDGFLVRNVNRDESTGFTTEVVYNFIGLNGEEKFRNLSAQNIIENPNYLKYLVKEHKADSIFSGPNGFYKHSQINDQGQTYYYKTEEGVGLFSPVMWGDFIAPSWQVSPKKFVHANRDTDYEFWITDDSVYLKTTHGLLVEPLGDIRIIYLQNTNEYEDYEASAKDSIYTEHNVLNNFDSPMAFSSFEIKGNLLIVNDQYITDMSCLECIDTQDNWYNAYIVFQAENSTVWKNINGSWQKMTPYYAAVYPVENGTYIVSTGSYKKEFDYYDKYDEPLSAVNITSRYLLLDSNFNAMNFVDYFDFNLIDDLGFGYKICLDQGCFFMTYDFKILTDAAWDEFLPTENKNEINAIRRAVPLFDEYGDFVYDEEGNWIEEVSGLSEIIKLP